MMHNTRSLLLQRSTRGLSLQPCTTGTIIATKASTTPPTISGSSMLMKHRLAATITTKTTTTRTHTSTRQFSKRNKATVSTPSPVSKEQRRSFMQWYEQHLQERPVMTKMITGCFLWGLGDFVAQVAPKLSMVSSSSTEDSARTTTTSGQNGGGSSSIADIMNEYDVPRTARAAFFGFAIHAPTSHLHFNFLEYLTHRAGVTGLRIPIFKAFMEQFVYWSWFSNSLYHGAMGAMQGYTPTQIVQRINDVLWETQKAQWAFWIPVQLLNFQYTPVRHQLNVVLVTSIVWTALLSAWYPPGHEETDDAAATNTTTKEKLKTDDKL